MLEDKSALAMEEVITAIATITIKTMDIVIATVIVTTMITIMITSTTTIIHPLIATVTPKT